MTLTGTKVATKDIDIVFSSRAGARDFMTATQRVGFDYVHEQTDEYDALGASAIMENKRGMRFDIFDRQVCRALELSKGMKSRARLFRSFDNLEVFLMTPEDIFLFKGITERETDLDDMRILAEAGLDWRTIKNECLSQKKSGRWAYMLGTKLLELRAKFGISSPISKTLLDHGDMDLLIYAFNKIIGKEESTFTEIAQVIKEKHHYSDSWTRKQLGILAKNKVVGVRKKGRLNVYYMKRIA